jgi:hypothetical protein
MRGISFFGAGDTAPKRRHHDEPAIGQLVITHNGVSIVHLLAGAAKTPEYIAGLTWAVKNAAGAVKSFAFLAEDSHPGVDDLNDMIGSDGKGIVGRASVKSRTLWPFEPFAQAVETGYQLRRRTGAKPGLLDSCGSFCGFGRA